MSLNGWLEERLGLEAVEPGLDRIARAISLLNLDLNNKQVVTIGGTNGKGQTSREFYRHAQNVKRSALWTSPHIVSVTERFVINGAAIGEEKLLETFEKLYKKFLENHLRLSYYEFLFASFLELAKDCELLVLEVGLGGRYDAVNALDADLVLLTSIGRDHQEYLGPRLDGILVEKFQLARKGSPVITSFDLLYLRQKMKELSLDRECEWRDLFHDGSLSLDSDYSERNRALARAGLIELFGDADYESSGGEFIFFDFKDTPCHAIGAHNPDGMRKCVQFLRHGKYTNSYKLILMSLSKRDLSDGLAMLKSVLSWTIENEAFLALVGFDHPKAMERKKLSLLADMVLEDGKRPELKTKIKFFNDASEALHIRPVNKKNPPLLVLGSNYFIGDLAKGGPISRH